MSKENPDAADAVAELKKGLGHLFNAAKSAVNDLPTKNLEDAVLTGVKEVGRALGNVKDTLESELLGKTEKASAPPPAQPASASPTPAAPDPSATQAAAASEQMRIADDAAQPAAATAVAAPPPAAEPDVGGGI